MLDTCAPTVFTLMKSASAIWRFVRPSANWARTSSSRAVSPSSVAADGSGAGACSYAGAGGGAGSASRPRAPRQAPRPRCAVTPRPCARRRRAPRPSSATASALVPRAPREARRPGASGVGRALLTYPSTVPRGLCGRPALGVGRSVSRVRSAFGQAVRFDLGARRAARVRAARATRATRRSAAARARRVLLARAPASARTLGDVGLRRAPERQQYRAGPFVPGRAASAMTSAQWPRASSGRPRSSAIKPGRPGPWAEELEAVVRSAPSRAPARDAARRHRAGPGPAASWRAIRWRMEAGRLRSTSLSSAVASNALGLAEATEIDEVLRGVADAEEAVGEFDAEAPTTRRRPRARPRSPRRSGSTRRAGSKGWCTRARCPPDRPRPVRRRAPRAGRAIPSRATEMPRRSGRASSEARTPAARAPSRPGGLERPSARRRPSSGRPFTRAPRRAWRALPRALSDGGAGRNQGSIARCRPASASSRPGPPWKRYQPRRACRTPARSGAASSSSSPAPRPTARRRADRPVSAAASAARASSAGRSAPTSASAPGTPSQLSSACSGAPGRRRTRARPPPRTAAWTEATSAGPGSAARQWCATRPTVAPGLPPPSSGRAVRISAMRACSRSPHRGAARLRPPRA